MHLALCMLLVVGSITPFVSGLAAPAVPIKLRVCQNKDCCKRFQDAYNLVETFQDLVDPSTPVVVESSDCLSECGKGPNVESIAQKRETLHHGIENAAAAAVLLEELSGSTVSPTLSAAVNVLGKAQKATTSLEQKEKFLTSVLRALDADDVLSKSHAKAHAHALRGQARLDAQQFEIAKTDANLAIALGWTRAYRILADSEEGLGNTAGAVEAFQQWGAADPAFRTKVNKEIQRLVATTSAAA